MCALSIYNKVSEHFKDGKYAIKQPEGVINGQNGEIDSMSIVGDAPLMHSVYNTIDLVANSDYNKSILLITGETGTGKSLVALATHCNSEYRSAEPFVQRNIAAYPTTLFESELYGHERGAFTDAKRQRQGLFQTAGKGTVFLDEIGDFTLQQQAKILHVLQERSYTPVGSDVARPVESKIIVATNKDLKAMVREGTFREDLYYRVNVITIDVPPLREVLEIIPQLFNYYIQHFKKVFRKKLSVTASGKTKIESYLTGYSWPGNARELKNLAERVVFFGEGTITVEDVKTLLSCQKDQMSSAGIKAGSQMWVELGKQEKEMIESVMDDSHGNVTLAANRLGIGRTTVYRKLKKYGIKVDSHSNKT